MIADPDSYQVEEDTLAIVGEILQRHWLKYAHWARTMQSPEARSTWGQCAMSMATLRQELIQRLPELAEATPRMGKLDR